MRSQWFRSVPAGRAPSFSGGNTAGEQQGTAVLHTYANNNTHTHSNIAHTSTHSSLPWVPPSHTLIYLYQHRQGKGPRCTTAMDGKYATLATSWSLFFFFFLNYMVNLYMSHIIMRINAKKAKLLLIPQRHIQEGDTEVKSSQCNSSEFGFFATKKVLSRSNCSYSQSCFKSE